MNASSGTPAAAFIMQTDQCSGERLTMKASDSCPCGSSQSFNACCGRWHAGEPAPTAEALMRSRYAAFSRSNEAYLLRTWHPSTRPKAISFDSQQKWLWLKVVDASVVGVDTAEVEFIACYRMGGG